MLIDIFGPEVFGSNVIIMDLSKSSKSSVISLSSSLAVPSGLLACVVKSSGLLKVLLHQAIIRLLIELLSLPLP